MYNRFLVNFGNFATKFYSKGSIQQAQYKFIGLQCNFSIQTSALVTRGYNTIPQIHPIQKHYKEQYQQQLDQLLQEPKYKVMYDKYKLEIEYSRNFYKVPDKLTPHNWLILLETRTKTQRRKYLEFLWKVARKDENQLEKKKLKTLQRNERIQEDDSQYGLTKVSMFYRIRDKTITHFYNGRLISAMLYEPIVVFDLGYDEIMTPIEQLNCAKQLLLSFSNNRSHDQPFNLYFCNAKKNTVVMEKLHTTIPSLYNEEFPLNITSKSYLDIFNKKQLVYLTPHANETMTKYDPNLIYIIGALVDKVDPKPHSFQKARREGIKMLKYPLSQNLDWGSSSGKNLPFNQAISVLLELRRTGNWKDAFTCIPRRKLREAREHHMEKLIMKRQQQLQALEKKE